MNIISLLLLLLLLSWNLSLGQSTVPVIDFNITYNKLHKTQTEEAKVNKFKSIKTYLYKNENLTNGKLESVVNYDEKGLRLYSLEHRFHRYKDYMQWNYSHDSLDRIRKIVISDSFGTNDEFYQFEYTIDNNIEYVISGYVDASSSPDTIFFVYFEDGRTKYEVGSKFNKYPQDTIYYHYNEYGDVSRNRTKIDTVDFKIRNEKGCIIGYNYNSDNEHITTMVCDSLCNVISYKEEIEKGGKKITVRSGESIYNGKTCIEKKRYSCPCTVVDKCNGSLKLKYHSKYEYNEKGFLTKETSYNNKGKIIEIKQTVYETLFDARTLIYLTEKDELIQDLDKLIDKR